jgi:hypothetical protein
MTETASLKTLARLVLERDIHQDSHRDGVSQGCLDGVRLARQFGTLRVARSAPQTEREREPTLATLEAETQNFEPAPETWTDAQEERAAIVEHDGGAPRAWAEALARLDPNKPPGDVQPRRWLRFIDDCGRFLDGGWAVRAAALGWGPLDLFGCDRERPFARVDHLGLLWLLNGGTVVELHRDRAILETERGVRQCYRRRPVEVGRVVLAWEGHLWAEVK